MNLLRWLIWFLLPMLLLVSAAGGGGCVRTVYVPHGTPVRLRETVPGVKVWVKDTDGKPLAGKMDLPEGWYALPLDSQE